ncbi:MAG: fibronectin type III domain-containing protein [Acidobacteriota bacterium]|nr:fibronectin type III domain-containing protein [Acidobacteriota bacterium]
MTKMWVCAALVLGSAAGAAAQPGTPVVGLEASVYLNTVGVEWLSPLESTDDNPLDGFTMFAASTPGGAILARLELPWPPPDPEHGNPGFGIPNVPDGTYYVAVVQNLVQSATIPTGDWARVTVAFTSCGSAPGTPTNLRRSIASMVDVLLSWDFGPGCPPESMVLEAGYSPGASDAGVFQLPVQIGWGGAAPPGTYYVRVRARNRYGISGPSNEVQVITGDTCSGPGAPRNLTFTVVNHRVTLNWQLPSDSGSRPVSFYHLIAGSVSGGTNVVNYLRVTTNSMVADNVPSGTYYVRVAAGNTCSLASGPPSNEVTVVVP